MAQYAILIVLLVMVVALFVVSYVRKKKYTNELGQMREELKIGDKVMTDTGVVGEVVDSYTEDEYKYFVLKSGRGNNVGYFAVHANAIYYVFGKEEEKKQNMANVKKEHKKSNENNEKETQTSTKENITETNSNSEQNETKNNTTKSNKEQNNTTEVNETSNSISHETKIDGEVVKSKNKKKR